MQNQTAGTGNHAIDFYKPNLTDDAGLEAAINRHHRAPATITTPKQKQEIKAK